jgi:hypothetical protein
MNKLDEAWSLLKQLPAAEQEVAADAILDFAAQSDELQLDEQQLQELRRRFDDTSAKTVTIEEFRRAMIGYYGDPVVL